MDWRQTEGWDAGHPEWDSWTRDARAQLTVVGYTSSFLCSYIYGVCNIYARNVIRCNWKSELNACTLLIVCGTVNCCAVRWLTGCVPSSAIMVKLHVPATTTSSSRTAHVGWCATMHWYGVQNEHLLSLWYCCLSLSLQNCIFCAHLYLKNKQNNRGQIFVVTSWHSKNCCYATTHLCDTCFPVTSNASRWLRVNKQCYGQSAQTTVTVSRVHCYAVAGAWVRVPNGGTCCQACLHAVLWAVRSVTLVYDTHFHLRQKTIFFA